MIFPFGETATVLDGTATVRDGDGNDVGAWTPKGTYTVGLAPADGSSASEVVQGQDLVVSGLTAYFPDGANVTAVDRVFARGQIWEVTELPQAWVNPFTGSRPGIPVSLRRVTG